jgi:hypothetical protein
MKKSAKANRPRQLLRGLGYNNTRYYSVFRSYGITR